jgi:hypothetical protein
LSSFPHAFLSGLMTVTRCHLWICFSTGTNEHPLNIRVWVAGGWVGAKLLLLNVGGKKMVAAW